jgi:hypothetical protein
MYDQYGLYYNTCFFFTVKKIEGKKKTPFALTTDTWHLCNGLATLSKCFIIDPTESHITINRC